MSARLECEGTGSQMITHRQKLFTGGLSLSPFSATHLLKLIGGSMLPGESQEMKPTRRLTSRLIRSPHSTRLRWIDRPLRHRARRQGPQVLLLDQCSLATRCFRRGSRLRSTTSNWRCRTLERKCRRLTG